MRDVYAFTNSNYQPEYRDSYQNLKHGKIGTQNPKPFR